MPRLSGNGVELEYDERGEGPPVVLIMGIGAQMILWPEPFVERLAAAGHRVIRFDNRDIGRSTWLREMGVPPIGTTMARWAFGLPVAAPYTLSDMAADTVALLDGLGLEAAHLVGASMGGMIAQTVALEHPARVRSLTSIMSSPGSRAHAVGDPRALLSLLGPAPRDREQAGERFLELVRVIGGPHIPPEEEPTRALGRLAFDRGSNPAGFLRQMAAILASGDRSAALRGLRTPTLVLHGAADPLIPPRAGRATAALIPGARFELINKMGHSLPPAVWPRLVALIAGHVQRAPPPG